MTSACNLIYSQGQARSTRLNRLELASSCSQYVQYSIILMVKKSVFLDNPNGVEQITARQLHWCSTRSIPASRQAAGWPPTRPC